MAARRIGTFGGGAGGGDAFRRRGRAAAAGDSGALLSDARLGGRRRGRGAGDLPTGVARFRSVRAPGVDADLAAPDRHERLPAFARATRAPVPAGRAGRSGGRLALPRTAGPRG